MKKFRVNIKRLTMTLGVLGTSAGLLAAAAWYQAPLAASQPPGDPALLAEPTADELAAIGVAEPSPVDPLQELSVADTDELRDPKAGKHGPTQMALAGADLGDQAPAVARVADTPLEPGAAGASALADAAPAPASRAPLVTLAAMDAAAPAVAAAPVRRAAVGWRPVGRIWRGENASHIDAKPGVATAAIAEIGEARYDVAAHALAIPVDGRLGRRGLVIHRLNDGRAYVDLPGTRPSFSGSRAQNVREAPISRWVMAAHAGPAGEPVTRVAFRLEGGAIPRLEVGGGEVRIALAPGTGGARAAAPAQVAAAKAAPGTKLGEARYDVAAGVLSLPIDGSVDAASLRLKRLGDGRAYLDVAGAVPTFSGTRSAEYPGQQLVRWKMAGHIAAGQTLTRLAFTLAKPGEVDVRVADGEIRLTLPGHTGIRSAPLAPAEPAPAGGMSEEEAVDADIQ